MDQITISGYQPEYAEHFKSLNVEWISKYFTVEEEDLKQLENLEESVLRNGGVILFAHFNHEVAGTCALIKTGEGEYQLAKMGISPEHRGKKIGNKLMEAALEAAKQLHASKIWLGSNTQLVPALSLYRKYGFQDIPLQPSPYSRANVRMELVLR